MVKNFLVIPPTYLLPLTLTPKSQFQICDPSLATTSVVTKTSKSEATPTCSASSEADNSSLVTKLRQADAERERLQSRSLESNHHHHNGLRGLRSDEEATLLESSEDTDMVAKKMKRATQVSYHGNWYLFGFSIYSYNIYGCNTYLPN